MKRLFGLIFILNLLNTKAQEFDSIVDVAKQFPSDTQRVNLFYSEGFNKRNSDLQYSYNCAMQAKKIAERSNTPFYISKAYNLLGILYYKKGDLTNALNYHRRALRLRRQISNKQGIAQSQINIGNVYSDLKQNELAEKSYLEALRISYELKLENQIDKCIINLGVLFATEASSKKDTISAKVAMTYFSNALIRARSRFDYDLEAMCLNNLSVMNMILTRYDDAIGNALNSIKIKDIMDNRMEMADSYLNIAACFLKKNDFLSCSTYLVKADSLIQEFDYKLAAIQSLIIHADYCEKNKEFEQSLRYLKRSYALKDSISQITNNMKLNASFIEDNNEDRFEKESPKTFPFLYVDLLSIMAIMIAFFVFKFKR